MGKIIAEAALRSGMGCVRQNNEDSFFFNGQFSPLKDMDQEMRLSRHFSDDHLMFAICDGMGGHDNGEVASYTAVSRMPDLQTAVLASGFNEEINHWVEKTNSDIRKNAHDGGCTLALLYIQPDHIFVSHIGDSRVYRFFEGKLTRVTKDHSKLQVLLDAGLIREEDADNYPQKHVVTRALGMSEEEAGKCVPTTQTLVPAKQDDRYVICSDGITDMLKDRQIEEILSQEKDAEACAEKIYEAALEAGGADNASVIVVFIEKIENDDPKSTIKKPDKLERTWTPESQSSDVISIEQVMMIHQANGKKLTIRSHISGDQLGTL